MPPIDQIVKVDISQSTKAVAQPSFSIPLIVGPTDPGWDPADKVHVYTSAEAMLTDGYDVPDPEYAYALALMSQPITPSQFLVGKRTTPIAQVDTFAVNTPDVGARAYAFTLNGTVCTYTSTGADTQQAILTALRTAALATGLVTGAVVGTGSGALLTLTAVAPGAVLAYTAIDTHLTHVALTAPVGVANDIAAIKAQNDTWYGWMVALATDADILQAAAWTEAQKKIFLGTSSSSGIGTSSTSDVASKMKNAGYARSGVCFSPGASTDGVEAAWMGGQLPQTPGSNNWAFKTLAGIAADSLTDTQRSNAIGNPVAGIAGKNANIHTPVGGVNITQMGTMAGGQFIDITVGVDWLQAVIQTNLFSFLANSPKIPFTDAGTAVLISGVRAAIDQGVNNGLIDPAGISVTADAVADVSTNQRAQRIAPTINFACRLQGAFNAVQVDGTVSV